MTATTNTVERLALNHAPAPRRERSPFVQGVLSVRRNRSAMLGLIVFCGWLLIGVFAPLVAPKDPIATNTDVRLESPSRHNLFGTDELGRDIFSRVAYGARVTVPAGLGTVAAALIIGVALGALAGYLGGWVDAIIMRSADVVLAFPSIILALAITAVRGGPGLSNALVAIVLVLWPEYARVMRGAVLALRENEYITAAEAVGANRWRILTRHILPGTRTPLVVKGTLDVGGAIVLTAGLSFIGLGAVPPDAEWGAMISLARTKPESWWLGAFPAIAITSIVLALNFIGDGLRDALDPRMRK